MQILSFKQIVFTMATVLVMCAENLSFAGEGICNANKFADIDAKFSNLRIFENTLERIGPAELSASEASTYCYQQVEQKPTIKIRCFIDSTDISPKYQIYKNNALVLEAPVNFSRDEALADCTYNQSKDSSISACRFANKTLKAQYFIQTTGTKGAWLGPLFLTPDQALADCKSHRNEGAVCKFENAVMQVPP